MPWKRFRCERIASALRQAEGGVIVGEVRRKMGVAEATFHRWKKVSAGMGVAEIRGSSGESPGASTSKTFYVGRI